MRESCRRYRGGPSVPACASRKHLKFWHYIGNVATVLHILSLLLVFRIYMCQAISQALSYGRQAAYSTAATTTTTAVFFFVIVTNVSCEFERLDEYEIPTQERLFRRLLMTRVCSVKCHNYMINEKSSAVRCLLWPGKSLVPIEIGPRNLSAALWKEKSQEKKSGTARSVHKI